MTKNFFMLMGFAALFLLAGCAAGPNTMTDSLSASGDIAGFWMGLWHGIICPITFILSLFSDNISIYEVYNNGGWYDFGFLIGAGVFFSGGGASSR